MYTRNGAGQVLALIVWECSNSRLFFLELDLQPLLGLPSYIRMAIRMKMLDARRERSEVESQGLNRIFVGFVFNDRVQLGSHLFDQHIFWPSDFEMIELSLLCALGIRMHHALDSEPLLL